MKLKSLPKVALLRVKWEEGYSCCRPYEKILQWKAGKLSDDSVVSVGVGGFNQDMFVVKER